MFNIRTTTKHLSDMDRGAGETDMAAGGKMAEMNELTHALQSNRLISIFIGDVTKPYLVQHSTLSSASDYFNKALQPGAFKEGETACLHFPDDHSEAWEILLFWMLKHALPKGIESDDELLIHCWVLGDKYGLPSLQDETMLRLLQFYDSNCSTWPTYLLGASLTPPGSRLRRLIAEEVIDAATGDGKVATDELGRFDGIVGFIGDLFRAREAHEWGGHLSFKRFGGLGPEDRPTWEEFLVGEKPQKHWVYDYVAGIE